MGLTDSDKVTQEAPARQRRGLGVVWGDLPLFFCASKPGPQKPSMMSTSSRPIRFWASLVPAPTWGVQLTAG